MYNEKETIWHDLHYSYYRVKIKIQSPVSLSTPWTHLSRQTTDSAAKRGTFCAVLPLEWACCFEVLWCWLVTERGSVFLFNNVSSSFYIWLVYFWICISAIMWGNLKVQHVKAFILLFNWYLSFLARRSDLVCVGHVLSCGDFLLI